LDNTYLDHSFFLELEEIANQPQEKRLKVPEQEVKYCIYMMEKHGENYKVSVLLLKKVGVFEFRP
jgi:hypothetical protein